MSLRTEVTFKQSNFGALTLNVIVSRIGFAVDVVIVHR